MPQVQMPDGALVNMPDNPTPEQKALIGKLLKPKDVEPPVDKPAPEDPTSVMNLIGAAVEPGISMVTGGVGNVVGSAAGLVTPLTNMLGLSHDDPRAVADKISSSMTYQPRTTGGKNAMLVFDAPGELAHAGMQKVDEIGTQFGVPKIMPDSAAQILGLADQLGLALAGGKGGEGALPERSVLPHAFGGKGQGTSSAVNALADRGVTMTPGQIKGGWADGLEQKLSSIPYIGDIIKNARGKSVEQFSQATVNDGLKDLGGKPLPKDLKGHEAMQYAGDQFDAAYGETLPKMKGTLGLNETPGPRTSPTVQQPGVPEWALASESKGPKYTPGSLGDQLEQIKAMAQEMPEAPRAKLINLIDKDVIKRFTDAGGLANGDTIKIVQQSIRNFADEHMRSTSADDRIAALGATQVQAELTKMLARENPALAARLKAIDKGYAKFKIAEVAAARTGAKEGVASPAQFKSSVRQFDRSKDKRKFARGRALQQPLAESGEKVLGNTVPNSHTTDRALAAGAVLQSGGAYAAFLAHPMLGTVAIMAPLVYSQAGLKFLQPFLMGKKSAAKPAAALMGAGTTGSPDQYGIQKPNEFGMVQ